MKYEKVPFTISLIISYFLSNLCNLLFYLVLSDYVTYFITGFIFSLLFYAFLNDKKEFFIFSTFFAILFFPLCDKLISCLDDFILYKSSYFYGFITCVFLIISFHIYTYFKT